MLLRRFIHSSRTVSAATSSSLAPAVAAARATTLNPLASSNDLLKSLLSARKTPWPVTEPAMSSHSIIYTPPSQPLKSDWTPKSRRVGVLALKAGMTSDWDKWGVRHALTVLRVSV